MVRETASSMLPPALLWMLMGTSLWPTGATAGYRYSSATCKMRLRVGRSNYCQNTLPPLFPGVWRKRFLPLLHQHIGRPPVRAARTGPDLRRTCGRGRLWQPLLQGLPLPAMMQDWSRIEAEAGERAWLRNHWGKRGGCKEEGLSITDQNQNMIYSSNFDNFTTTTLTRKKEVHTGNRIKRWWLRELEIKKVMQQLIQVRF